ncbi:UDP-N-acetylglucosamine transferase subunit ALG13 homolog [Corticium candelabrum]|uniref:UDP-N-acetylglucosamine transferase subunit ALG13 homolog n=1 Tax=Corticium candelabrum TaxID=121492 RepID=UPI002E26FD8B|nr:UDP-N-acetylglucosamine transferase subunit ALG13 homolog [Corticium candelabrum]
MATVFVTVGTTKFDELIETVTSDSIKKVLLERDYDRLLLQIGRGSFEPVSSKDSSFVVESYQFKNSLSVDLQEAKLVISHAGAGCILETLDVGKPLVVVVNEKLMDNHQFELARRLHKDNHLLYCTCNTLEDTLRTMDLSSLRPFNRGHPEKLGSYLDSVMGHSSTE